MKSYIRNHIISSIFIAVLGFGAAHMLAAAATASGPQSQSAQAQQEIAQIMQQQSGEQSGSVPTLGQIGQNLGGFFHGMTPR